MDGSPSDFRGACELDSTKRGASRASFAEMNVDRGGAICSCACAVHCIVGALFPSLFAVLGIGGSLGSKIEWIAAVFAIVFAAVSMNFARKNPATKGFALVFALLIVGLISGRVLESSGFHSVGSFLGIASGLALATTHLLLMRRVRRGCEP